MVQLKEVEDEHFTQPQPGPPLEENDDDYYTDTDSEISAASSDAGGLNETLADRLLALRDVIPPVQRARLGAGLTTGYRWVAAGLTLGGKSLWVLSTSAMLVGIPWALAFTEEAQMMEMEKEMKMQQSANELLAPGASQQVPGQQGARPAL